MDAETCIKKIGYVGIVEMATVDRNGDPQVRVISTLHFEGHRIYFLTARGKPFAEEIALNGKLQIIAFTRFKETIRAYGHCERVTPAEEEDRIRDAVFEEQPYMSNVYPGKTRSILSAYVLEDYGIEYFNLGTHPIDRAVFDIGDHVSEPKGYFITDRCIGCGKCVRNCPQQVIAKGKPSVIDPDHCLHCGNCFEVCPVQAVVHRRDLPAVH